MAIRALFFAAAIALICATPALGVACTTLECCNAAVPTQTWRCAKCSAFTGTTAENCYRYESIPGIDSDAIVTCSRQADTAVNCLTCLNGILAKSGPYNDWRCLKCTDPSLASATIGARVLCYFFVQLVNQADDVVTCTKTYPSNALLNQRFSCQACLAARSASGTWPCMSCAAKGATTAADNCFTCLNNLSKSWECAQL